MLEYQKLKSIKSNDTLEYGMGWISMQHCPLHR